MSISVPDTRATGKVREDRRGRDGGRRDRGEEVGEREIRYDSPLASLRHEQREVVHSREEVRSVQEV
jgi:hypothetical protein